MRSSGSIGKNQRYSRPCYIHVTVVQIEATSLPGFHIRKQMHHPLSFGMGHQSVYLAVYVVIIFINCDVCW